MNAHALAAGSVPPPLSQAPPSQADGASLTLVSLAYVEHRVKVYLRFGEPSRTLRLDRWRRVAMFLPGAVFCRVRWQANDYGTVRWQLMVMQSCTPLDVAQRVPGVLPGARILLRAESEQAVRTVLPLVDAIEALGIEPAAASPAYWRTLGNRLAARQPLPLYSAERHAAWLAGMTSR